MRRAIGYPHAAPATPQRYMQRRFPDRIARFL